jgi:hypothetical protein
VSLVSESQEPTAFIYLTFDDGPNFGTNFVLDALKQEGVRATFFINSINLFDPMTEIAERNIKRSYIVVYIGSLESYILRSPSNFDRGSIHLN